MGVKKYLDEQGLATLWEKIKNVFAKKSDIPVVNNAKLTVQKNGTNVGTFTANQSTDTAINITVPTGAAADKDVDTSIASGSTSQNLPTSQAVAEHVNSQIKIQVTDQIGTTIAPLGKDGIVPAAYLPSYVDDTVEGYYSNGKFYTNSSHTQEIAGESGKIYVDLTENKTYRWSGTMFIEISKSLAIGTIAGTAYDGASGAKNASDIANLQLEIDTKVDKIAGKGLSTNDYTNEEKNKLANIANGAEVNVQSDWDVTDANSDAFIKNKPTFDEIVTEGGAVTTAGTGLSKSGNTLNHSNSITPQTTSKIVAIKVDGQGHISAIGDSLDPLTTTEINEILV